MLRICLHTTSILGTPSEDDWPGIQTYPDFKPSFPKWQRNYAQPLVASLDEAGLELLDGFLVYDPASRISAKQAIIHPYFNSAYGYAPQENANGYH